MAETTMLEPFFIGYMAIWMSACLVAVGIFIRNPGAFSLLQPEYRRFLLAPWKIATFAMATAGLTIIAPYSGDPTWDYVDALFMSILTFCGAPWVVGVIYLCARRRRPLTHLFVALCLGLFSVSWSYDFYILMRDGFYPATWFANIFASLSLYIPAGLLWNLDWRPNRGVTFSFLENDWPSAPNTTAFAKVFGYALPFMLTATAGILYLLHLNRILPW